MKIFEKSTLVRKIIRLLLAVAFWAHAIFVMGLVHLQVPHVLAVTDIYNVALVAFIVNYSFFSTRGWGSVTFDFLYIYFFPFILTGKALWALVVLFGKHANSRVKFQKPQLIVKNTPDAAVSTVQKPKESTDGRNPEMGLKAGLLRLFSKFAVLWAILILTLSFPPFVVAAIAITLNGTLMALLSLFGLFSGNLSWLDRAVLALSTVTTKHVNEVMNWTEEKPVEEVTKDVNGLKLFMALYNFLSVNKDLFNRWAFAISLAVSIPYYIYISFLFSCVYFGIAKVQGLHFSWSYAFLDSLYIPFAWTELPRSFPMRFVAGLQAICVTIIGWNIFFRHLGIRIEKITNTARQLNAPFQEDAFRSKLKNIEESLSKKGHAPSKLF